MLISRVVASIVPIARSNAALGACGLVLQLAIVPIGIAAAGPRVLGEWMALYAIIQIGVMADFGLQAALVRSHAGQLPQVNQAPVRGVGFCCVVSVPVAIATMGTIITLNRFFGLGEAFPTALVVLAGFTVIAGITMKPWQATTLGEGRYKLDKLFILIAACIRISLYIGAVWSSHPLVLIVAADVLFLLIPCGLSMLHLRRRVVVGRTPERLADLLRFGIPWFSTQFLSYAAVMLPTTIVGVTAGSQEAVGVGASSRIFGGIRQLQSWIVEPLFAMAASGKELEPQLEKIQKRSITFVRVTCTGVLLISPQLLNLWLADPAVVPSALAALVIFMIIAYAQAPFLGPALVGQAQGRVGVVVGPTAIWSIGGLMSLAVATQYGLRPGFLLYGAFGLAGALVGLARVHLERVAPWAAELLIICAILGPVVFASSDLQKVQVVLLAGVAAATMTAVFVTLKRNGVDS